MRIWVLPNCFPGRKKSLIDLFKIINLVYLNVKRGFPGGSDGKESACSVGDLGSFSGWEDPLEKGIATYSSILAWRIPWTEETGGIQSMGSQRVRHD